MKILSADYYLTKSIASKPISSWNISHPPTRYKFKLLAYLHAMTVQFHTLFVFCLPWLYNLQSERSHFSAGSFTLVSYLHFLNSICIPNFSNTQRQARNSFAYHKHSENPHFSGTQKRSPTWIELNTLRIWPAWYPFFICQPFVEISALFWSANYQSTRFEESVFYRLTRMIN